MLNLSYNESVITSGVTKDVVSDLLSGVCAVPSHHIHIAAMNMQQLTRRERARKKSQQETEIIFYKKNIDIMVIVSPNFNKSIMFYRTGFSWNDGDQLFPQTYFLPFT